ncbi:MAG: YitT family protein, partial [Bacilli bacterium]|nr:YitT family protein [Bacilli bacterium]
RVMYAIIILYIHSLMADKIILGISDNKAFYIITDKEEEVKKYVLDSLNHGVTILKAKGGYDGRKENVLLCVVPARHYFKLKEGISLIDSEAFFVVTDAYEVKGGA